ncbi:MAG: c-type cytochrome [Polyangiales bacterium]
MTPSRVLTLFLAAGLLAACGRGPTREWQATDHDEEPGSTGQAAVGAKGGKANANGADLVEATWGSACATCHGALGRGDGPNGPMVKATDLTQPALQDARSDGELAAVIMAGKGKMPKFDALPDTVVIGLVKKIRSLRAH